MSFLSRPFKNQFLFHEKIEYIIVNEPDETVILDPESSTVKVIQVKDKDLLFKLKFKDLDIIKLKLITPKLFQCKVIIQTANKCKVLIDDAIALSNIINSIDLLDKSELVLNFFSYNNGAHWNGFVSESINGLPTRLINDGMLEVPDDRILIPTYYEFNTSYISPIPGTVDNASSIACAYGPTTNAQLLSLYPHGNSLFENIELLGNGLQKFIIPEDMEVEITVQGANGGNNISANETRTYVGYGGRGAVLTGIYNFNKGDIVYILVGQVGWCNSYADWGAGGGGASVVFLHDKYNSSGYNLEATGLDVIPLMIAGGGAGRYDNGYTTNYNIAGGKYDIANENALINAKFTNGNITTAMTTYGSTYNSVGGGSLGAAYGYHAASGGRTVTSIALLKTPSTAAVQRPGGYGGGGSPYDWGGGGGGLNGGDGNQSSQLLSGGTSWMDSTVTEVSRGLVPLDQIIGKRPPQGKVTFKVLKATGYHYEF